MPLVRVRVDGLRILDGADLELDPRCNYVLGPNGSGKTSLLEGLYLIGRGRSFRTRQTRKLIQHGREALTVHAAQEHGVEQHRVGVKVDGDGVSFRIDRQPAGSVTELARLFAVDVIDPSVHRLIEGGPSERRRFLDWGVFHVEHRYLDVWKRYRRTLGQRNAVLKQHGRDAELNVWEQGLVEAAEAVDRARAAYVGRLGVRVEACAQRLLGRALTIEYRRGWRAASDYAAVLKEARERDRMVGFTQSGPHRADIAIRLDGAAASDEASRGQQKLASAALVIAQVHEGAGERDGVLLVDDPAAEIDRAGLERLMAELAALPCQLVITGLSRDLLPIETDAPVFHVEHGKVRRAAD